MTIATTEDLFVEMIVPVRLDEFNELLDTFFVTIDCQNSSDEQLKESRIISVILQFLYNNYIYGFYDRNVDGVQLKEIDADYGSLLEKICVFLQMETYEMEKILGHYRVYSQNENENRALLCYQTMYQFLSLEELKKYGI